MAVITREVTQPIADGEPSSGTEVELEFQKLFDLLNSENGKELDTNNFSSTAAISGKKLAKLTLVTVKFDDDTLQLVKFNDREIPKSYTELTDANIATDDSDSFEDMPCAPATLSNMKADDWALLKVTFDYNGYTPGYTLSPNTAEENANLDFKDPDKDYVASVDSSACRYVRFRFKVNGVAGNECFKKCLNVRSLTSYRAPSPDWTYYDDQNLDAHINFTWAVQADISGFINAQLQVATTSTYDTDSNHDDELDGSIEEMSWPQPSNIRVTAIAVAAKE